MFAIDKAILCIKHKARSRAGRSKRPYDSHLDPVENFVEDRAIAVLAEMPHSASVPSVEEESLGCR